jgi:histone arginine demethylase JMJD6
MHMPISELEIPDYGRFPDIRRVPRVAAAGLTASEFRRRYSDQPVVFEGMAASWPAFSRWTPELFAGKYGDDVVSVSTVGRLEGLAVPWQTSVKLRTFIEAFSADVPLYLNEWYAFAAHPELLDDFEPHLPPFFEDWFELIPKGWVFGKSTRTNVRWGRPRTGTALHVDALNAVNWLAVLRGRKTWLQFSGRSLGRDGQGEFDREARQAGILDEGGFITEEGLCRFFERRPRGLEDATLWAADVTAGDVVYTPWGWYHQVHNLEPTLSVGRFYMSRENVEATRDFIHAHAGRAAAVVFDSVFGTEVSRGFWRSRTVQAVAGSPAGQAMFRALLGTLGVSPGSFAG